MLKSENRLKRLEFESFLGSKTRLIPGKIGLFKFAPGRNKFSIVISSKNCKKAVLRNKIKRRYYSIISKYIQNFKKPINGALFTSKEVKNMSFLEFKNQLIDLLNKANESL